MTAPIIRTFRSPAHVYDEPPPNEVCLGVELHAHLGWGQYYIFDAKKTSETPDPSRLRLSSILVDHPLGYPDPSGHHFWMKTYSENEGLLEALVEQGILEVVPGRFVKQEFVTFPLVKVNIHTNELARNCGWCKKWEHPANGNNKPVERFRACSRCKRTFYCSVDCQKKSWTRSIPNLYGYYPPHKYYCGA